MKNWNKLLASELKDYLRWLKVLEKTAHAQGCGESDWYQGKLLDLYTRVGPGCEVSKNEPFVCFSNVKVKLEYRSKGLFIALLKHIKNHHDELKATYLIIENVVNRDLVIKMDSLNFFRFEGKSPTADPTFYKCLHGRNSTEST